MTIREITNELKNRPGHDDKAFMIVNSVLDTEIVPKKLIDDMLEMFRIWKKNDEISLTEMYKYDDEENVENRPIYEGKISTLTDCIKYIEKQLKELEAEE